MKNRTFVFVVCGAAAHIKTLHFSINYLKHFSKNRIVVITDSSRNEIPVIHDNIIDIITPQEFDNHQASIWLKTGAHKFLPKGNTYCYLDSDVVAINKEVDSIFDYHVSPVTFAADHCTIDQFSPTALQCGCLEKSQNRQSEFDKLLESALPGYNKKNQLLNPEYRELYHELHMLKQHPVKNFKLLLNLLFPSTARNKNEITLNKKFYFDGVNRNWYNNKRRFITKDTILGFPKELNETGRFRFSRLKNTWVDDTNTPVFKNSCNHLIDEIKIKFLVDINKNNWQHWNGGVFLFDDGSADFLDTWHENTLKIFSDNRWRVRDQGTLAATVWQHGLQSKKLLPEEFNFLADFYNPDVMLHNEGPIVIKKDRKLFTPHFLHIYHEFGNEKWDIWKAIKFLNVNSR